MKNTLRSALYLLFSICIGLIWFYNSVTGALLPTKLEKRILFLIVLFIVVYIPRSIIAAGDIPHGYEERHRTSQELSFYTFGSVSTITSTLKSFADANGATFIVDSSEERYINNYGDYLYRSYTIRGLVNLDESIRYPKAWIFTEWQLVACAYSDSDGMMRLYLSADGCNGLQSNLSLAASKERLSAVREALEA